MTDKLARKEKVIMNFIFVIYLLFTQGDGMTRETELLLFIIVAITATIAPARTKKIITVTSTAVTIGISEKQQ